MAAESGNINDLHKYQGRASLAEEEESDQFSPTLPRSSFGMTAADPLMKSAFGRQDSGVSRKLVPLPLEKIQLTGTSDREGILDENNTNIRLHCLAQLRFVSQATEKCSEANKINRNASIPQQRSDSIGSEEAELGTFGELPVYPVRFSKNRRHTLANVR